MSKKPDRQRAGIDVRLELRRQMQLLQAQGKTQMEIAEITGYTCTYVSTMLKRLASEPAMLESMSRGRRPQGSLRSLSAKEERRAQALICGECPDQLSLPFALWTRAAIRWLFRQSSTEPAKRGGDPRTHGVPDPRVTELSKRPVNPS